MMSKPRVPEDIAGRAGAAALAGLLVALLNPLPCAAAEPAIRLAPAAGSVTEYSAKVGAPSLNAEVRLRNTSNDPAQYRLGPFLTRSSDGLAYPATWRRLDAPVGDPSFAAAGADFVLQLSANLAEPGIYESWIDTFQKNATSGAETPDQRIHVVVTRESEPINADFILTPQPVRSVFGTPIRNILVQLHNSSPKAVEFDPPAVLSFSRKNGDLQDSISAARIPAIAVEQCRSPLAPGATCAIAVDVSDLLWPGQYSISVGVAGRGGGWSLKSMPVSVRFPYGVAFLATAVGVGAGWYVQAWRTGGRRAVNGLIEVATLRDRLRRLQGSLTKGDLDHIQRSIADDLDGTESRCRNGADIAGDLDRIRQRIERLAVAAMIEAAYQSLPSEGKLVFSRWRAGFLGLAASASLSDAAAGEFDKFRLALSTNINAWPTLVEASTKAKATVALAEELAAVAPKDLDLQQLGPLRDALRQAIMDAFAALPPSPDAVVNTALLDRVRALEEKGESVERVISASCEAAEKHLRDGTEAIRTSANATEDDSQWAARTLSLLAGGAGSLDLPGRVARLSQLGRRPSGSIINESVTAPAGAQSPPATPAAQGIDLPPDVVFNLSSGQTLQALSNQRRRNELWTNVIVLVATGLAGVMLVASNDSWGSTPDIIAALLGGLGTRILLGEVGSATQSATH